MKNGIRQFDRAIGSWVLLLPAWMKLLMEFFTLIGQPPFTVGIAAAVLGYGAALEKPHYVLAGWIAIGTLISVSVLKLFLRRARPATEYVKQMLFHTFSFPSGHAAGGLVSYGLAAIVIGMRWPEFGLAAWMVAIFVSFFIGISRIYLGAHFASDVIGGWLVGALGLLLIFILSVQL